MITNGNVRNPDDVISNLEYTKADGVMAARGLLENPALFAGYDKTPVSAIQKYIKCAISYGSDQFIFHLHLMSLFDWKSFNEEFELFYK